MKNALGQEVWWTSGARLTMDAIKDPRFQVWELEDVELAVSLGRETLPWTLDYGAVLTGMMILAREQRKAYVE